MFDPHRTRRNDSRYFTRKGQVLQASRVSVNPVIDQRLVPVYRNYLINNNLLPPPIVPASPIKIGGVYIQYGTTNVIKFALSDMTLDTSPTVNITRAVTDKGTIIAIYEDTSGIMHITYNSFKTNPGTTNQLTLTIEDNKKCRYAYTTAIGESFGITNTWYKGVYDVDENILISSQYKGFNFSKNLGRIEFD